MSGATEKPVHLVSEGQVDGVVITLKEDQKEKEDIWTDYDLGDTMKFRSEQRSTFCSKNS